MWPFRRGDEPFGAYGERLALRHLRRRGLKTLARNFRCPAGEVDLIMLDPSTRKALRAETLVFVEVKTRRSDDYVAPAAAVNADKQRRIRRASRTYLASRDTSGYNIRYDVVSIVIPEGEKPRIEHIRSAF